MQDPIGPSEVSSPVIVPVSGEDVDAIMQTVAEAQAAARQKPKQPAPAPEALVDALSTFQTRYEFKAGDVVEFKPGMRGGSRFERFIVVHLVRPPLVNPEEDAGNSHYMEPLDMVCGTLTDSGNFMTWYFDSRRFRPFRPEAEKTAVEDESAVMTGGRHLSVFIEACCHEGKDRREASYLLYGAYQRWFIARKPPADMLSRKAFGVALRARGYVFQKSVSSYYLGLALRDEWRVPE